MLSYSKSYDIIEEALSESAFHRNPVKLYDPIEYIISMGGKRIRPCLTLMAHSVFSGNFQPALPAALAIEIFHNFTLLHDDIMDNAPIRRNHPTVHTRWNINTAILSGDAMLILAYDMLQKTKPEKFHDVFQLFNKTALEVCEGQQYDLDFETHTHVRIEEYLEMIRLKTAVLLACSLSVGGITGNAGETDIRALYDFGLNLGMAFQLQDDYLDIFAQKNEFGKTRGGDIVANKKTYMLIRALNTGNREAVEELCHWMGESPAEPQQKIMAISAIYKKLGIDRQTLELAESYYALAEKALENVSVDTNHKIELKKLVSQLMKREQ
jgi:geranylgeranyl diphosphate synthase type II